MSLLITVQHVTPNRTCFRNPPGPQGSLSPPRSPWLRPQHTLHSASSGPDGGAGTSPVAGPSGACKRPSSFPQAQLQSHPAWLHTLLCAGL